MTEELGNKIREAEEVLKLAAEMSKTYYDAPLIICYSGGKDSDVMLDIAKRCLDAGQFEVLNSHTTVDAPETVYHIREVFKRCETEGIHTKIKMPRYKGEPTSMWKLIEQKSMPPTRLVRYCCKYLKETSTPNRMIAVGVREDESNGRRGRGSFASREKRKNDADWKTLQHTYAMFKLDQSGNPDAYECQFIKNCKAHRDAICNPIYTFTEADVWSYAKEFSIIMNPLYEKGYKRVGCVGCPMATNKMRNKEFSDYPIYKKNYIKAFDRMQKRNEARGKYTDFKSGEDWFRWWLGENPKQVRFDDLLNDERN